MKGLGLILFCLLLVLGAKEGWALGYKDALKAYERQEYRKCYKISVALVDEVRATERAKLFILAGAAVLELDRESLARGYFRKALFYNPKVTLPPVVRSPRVHRYLDDVRTGKLRDPEEENLAAVEPEFDDPRTYLPLGINQFLQKKWTLGAAFAVAQTLPLYYAYENFKSADRVDELSVQSTVEAIASGDDINPIYIKYISDNNRYADKSRRQAQLQIICAVGAYAASVVEAALRPEARLGLSLTMGPNVFGGAYLALQSEF